MRILITGATGLVGNHLVNLCHEQGIQVHYLTTRRKALESRENYRGYYWDPARNAIDPACFEGVGSIVNLAGAPIACRWTKSAKKRILKSRTESLRTLAKGLEQVGAREVNSLVTASGIGGYPSSLSEYYHEDFEGLDASFIGEVVGAWEKEADALKRFDLSVAKIRVGLVLAEEGGALPQMARQVRLYAGAAYGSGEQWQSWIHVRDLARMFLFILNHRLEGLYNGVAPNPVTNAKLFREIARTLDKPMWLPNIPEYLMKLILGEMASVLFASQRASSRKIEDLGFDFQFSNVCRALEDIYHREEQSVSEARMAGRDSYQ